MSKVLGKRFLSCLCAFVSSIGMSFAAVNNNEYYASIVPCPAALINDVKDSTKKVIEKLSKLDNLNDCGLVRVGDYGRVGCVLGVSLVRKVEGFYYFCFKLYVNKCEAPGNFPENYACIANVDVYAGYVIERLGLAEKDVPNSGGLQGFIDSGENRFEFSRLFLKDVLGMKLDEGYYSSASAGPAYNPNSDGGVMTKESHPDYNGCFWRYFKKNIYDVFTKNDINLLDKVPSAEDVNNGVEFGGVDQKGIYEYFFGTPENPKMTNYYKAMVNVRWSAGAKAGLIVPTLLLFGSGVLYAVEKFLIEPMKDRSINVGFESLRNENRRLKIDADKVYLYESLCGKTGVGREIKKQVERKFNQNSIKVRHQNRFVPNGSRGRVKRSRNW